MTDTHIHCDDIIHDHSYPQCLRHWVWFNRQPAMNKGRLRTLYGSEPVCFAMWKDRRVRLVMASRFGNVGITEDLKTATGYSHRVSLDELSDFGEKP